MQINTTQEHTSARMHHKKYTQQPHLFRKFSKWDYTL